MKKSKKPTAAEAKKILNKAQNWNVLTQEEKEILATSVVCSREYAQFLGRRFEIGEPSIAKSSKQSYLYAKDVIRGRFYLGEKKIAEDFRYGIDYANNIIKGRFPELEKNLLSFQKSYFLYLYANDVIDGRWPEAEEIIKNDPKYAQLYAHEIIHGRWPEAEEIIKNDPKYALAYAKDVIQSRWIEAEEIIKDDPNFSCEYAKDIIHGRWPEAEEKIKDSNLAYYYAKNVIQGEWPEAEDAISNDSNDSINYAIEITNKRFEKAEKNIIKSFFEKHANDNNYWSWGNDIFNYLECCVQSRWKEFEDELLKNINVNFCFKYANSLMNCGVEVPEEINNIFLLYGMSGDSNYKRQAEEYFENKVNNENNRRLQLISHLSFEELERLVKNAK